MRAFLFGYTIVYVLAAIVVVADAIMNQDSKWKTAADALLFLCVAIGVVLYTFNIRIYSLVMTWRFISPLLVLGQLATMLYDRHLILSGKDPEIRRPKEGPILLTDLVSVLIMVPAAVLNLRFAYAKLR